MLNTSNVSVDNNQNVFLCVDWKRYNESVQIL